MPRKSHWSHADISPSRRQQFPREQAGNNGAVYRVRGAHPSTGERQRCSWPSPGVRCRDLNRIRLSTDWTLMAELPRPYRALVGPLLIPRACALGFPAPPLRGSRSESSKRPNSTRCSKSEAPKVTQLCLHSKSKLRNLLLYNCALPPTYCGAQTCTIEGATHI